MKAQQKSKIMLLFVHICSEAGDLSEVNGKVGANAEKQEGGMSVLGASLPL